MNKKSFAPQMFSTLFFSIVLFVSLFLSCNMDVGLGEEVDLEAPVISVRSLVSSTTELDSTELSGGNYVKKNITVTGTATDNKKVESVQIWTKYSNETSYSHLTNASLSGTEWKADISFPKEGAVFVRFLAVDGNDNSSPKSSRVITLFVDETAPVASAWYIDREINGIQYNLRDLETLKELDLNATENKDAAQNEQFKISATVTEAMGIQFVKMKILDEEGNLILTKEKTDDSSLYAPVFEVKKSELIAGNSALSSGAYTSDGKAASHFLHVIYDSADVTNPTNEVENAEIDGGYFIWLPENDIPRISISDLSANDTNDGTINLHVKDSLSITIFDDDALASAKCTLSGTGYTTTTKNWTATNNERETVMALSMPETPTTLTLKVEAVAATCNTQNSSSKNVTKTYTVNVTDDSTPLLLISEPSNNTTPAVSMSLDNSSATVTVKGQSYDTAGCNYLLFVWVPDSLQSSSKLTTASNYLNSLTSYPAASSSPTTISSGDYAGLKVWSVTLKSETIESGFKKQDFDFTFDLMSDFTCNGTNEKANSKYFLARLVRTDGKYSDNEYTLTADDLLPTIVGITPSQDMQIQEVGSDLVLEFYGKKDSGLAMDSSKYKIELVGYKDEVEDSKPVPYTEGGKAKNYELSGEYKTGIADSSMKTYQATISKDFLVACNNEGVKPKFQFYATDLFGNEGTAQYTVVLSSLPQLKSLSSTSSTIRKLGDEIIIYASFSDTVSVANGSKAYIKLAGISGSATNRDKAFYKEGSGSTTLQFSYTVQEGDSSSCLYINNSTGTPIVVNGDTTLSNGAHLDTLDSTVYPHTETIKPSNKTIQIDGTPPSVSSITFTSTADSTKNKDTNGVTWLNEGKTLTATIKMSEAVQIQGSPKFIIKVGSTEMYLPFASKNDSEKTITFQKKISSEDADPEGEITYIPSKCIKNGTSGENNSAEIVDSFGNVLTLNASTVSTKANFGIDTTPPVSPTVTIKDASSGSTVSSTKYNKPVLVIVSDANEKSTEFSKDAGSSWDEYKNDGSTNEINTAGAYTITARRTDWAGNISDYADPISLDINTNFPSFTVECQSADGNYKAGKTLTFKVQFANKVKVTGEGAYIQMSKFYDTDTVGTGANDGKALLTGTGSSKSTITLNTEIDSATFVYEVQDPDEFTLKIEQDGVKLNGFEDSYGIAWDESSKLAVSYPRSAIHCDGVAPKVVSMTPSGTKTSASDGLSVYAQGNVIKLVFSEEIQKASGNLILRQVKLWPLPPVLSATDFNTICNELDSDGKEYLAMRDSDGSYLEDAQPDIGLTNAMVPVLDLYHGRGQYVGPYKKSMQGIKLGTSNTYVPDTETKFVLDFDIDIWETDKEHYFGKTYTTYTQSDFNFGKAFTNGRLAITEPNSSSNGSLRTAQGIRDVLEKAGYHERVLDVTSASVVLASDNKTVTITFPQGLCDTSADLPYGREWELVIEKGAFMDATGNEFGAEADGTIAEADAVQASDGSKKQLTVGTSVSSEYGTYSGAWGRARALITDGSNPLVLIQDGTKDSFYSDKVATPVVRVDRYSYGFGIYQSDSSGNKASIIADKESTINGTKIANGVTYADAVEPTGYVRTRIDCETKNSLVSYKKATASYSTSSTLTEEYNPNGNNFPLVKLYEPTNPSSLTSFSGYTTETVSDKSNVSLIFAGGNGKYNEACKQFIVATATRTGFTDSNTGAEGIWQTVVCYNPPKKSGRNGEGVASNGEGYRNYYIRGTTGFGGEPYISPFPLRGGLLGTPYVRATYRENNGTTTTTPYYWVSYEVLVESSFLGRGSPGTGWTWNSNGCDQGKMEPGALSVITGMYLY